MDICDQLIYNYSIAIKYKDSLIVVDIIFEETISECACFGSKKFIERFSNRKCNYKFFESTRLNKPIYMIM